METELEITDIKQINKKNCGKFSKRKLSRFLDRDIPFLVYDKLADRFTKNWNGEESHKKMVEKLYNRWHPEK